MPTVAGPVTMTVPARANSGLMFRLKEKGIAYDNGAKLGDQYVKLIVTLPDRPNAELDKVVKSWSPERDEDVRKALWTE